jgi:hypothetical protein
MIVSQSLAAARDERGVLHAGEIIAGGGEHTRLEIELQPLAGELLEHVAEHHYIVAVLNLHTSPVR